MSNKKNILTKSEFIKQLTTLVGFETLTGNFAENKKALDYVQSLISPQAKIKSIKNEGAEILLISNCDSKTPDFGYLVHMDVVAATKNLFSLRQKGDLITGRGVSDMKFSIPLGIALLNEIIEQKSKINFCVAITTDEETGGFAGGAFLANNLNFKPKALIVPDGGDNVQFVEKAKGVCQFSILSQGKATHASQPWNGKNALPSLCRLAVKLTNLYEKNNQTKSWTTTMNLGQLQGGISCNQVCDEAVLKIDFRYPETNSIEKIEAKLRKLANNIDPNLIIEKGSTGLPTFTNLDLPVVKTFISCLAKEMRQKIKTQASFGASDARHFAKFNIPILMIKPMGGDIHANTEWLSISSTLSFYQGLRRFLGLK